MGRRLAGPVQLNNGGKVWYARLTVKPSDRARAGCTRLTRSLGTTDHTEALRRWPGAYQALQRELEQRLNGVSDVDLLKLRLQTHRVEFGELSPVEQAEIIVNAPLDEANVLHDATYQAITSGTPLLSWSDLLLIYGTTKERRRGRPVSQSTLNTLRVAIRDIELTQPLPQRLNKQDVKDLIRHLREKGLNAKTINVKCGLLQSLVQVGIEEDVLLHQVNPFTLVSFSASTREENRRRAFDLKTELPALMGSDLWPIYRLMVGTGLRIGEVYSRDKERDFDGMMAIIRTNTAMNWRPKTLSSFRRVPLDEQALEVWKALLPVSSIDGFESKLRRTLRRVFPDKPDLVVHSCRHTYKSITRLVGVSIEISDEISGHKKTTVSPTSDAYGKYPDELLLGENKKVWEYLDNL